MKLVLALILIFPLLGALINVLAGVRLPRRAVEAVACLSVGGSFMASVAAFMNMSAPVTVSYYDWISFGHLSAPVSMTLDALSGTMCLMITGVSALIHVYAVGYMEHYKGHARFFALLNLFVFSMLVLVLAANLPLLYLGWEGVGFCSYMLIGFWYEKTENCDAGRKAFVVTRIGDVAFGVAILWLFHLIGTVDISSINSAAASIPVETATIIGILLLIGAAGKSAQLPLTVWLPDAMAGPTPVSALIHAATMVTAGVYLLFRMYPVISVSKTALAAIAITGCLTAFYAATTALMQRDIKKVLAYSTMSQIGYMVMGVGAGALSGALFHLVVHAFFKALLFMSAGYIIHAMSEEQDIFKMGGLMDKLPVAFWSFVAGSLALCAAPGTAGFFSKDEILATVYAHHTQLYTSLWAVAEITAFITTVYIFRVIFLVFAGEMKKRPEKPSGLMSIAMFPLIALSLVGGVINMPKAFRGEEMLNGLLGSHGLTGGPHHEMSWGLVGLAAMIPVVALAVAYHFYIRDVQAREKLAVRYGTLCRFLQSGWGLDGLFERALVRPYGQAANILWKKVDEGIIDRSMDATAHGAVYAAGYLRRSVTGRTSTYLASILTGAAIILAYLAWGL
jgi:NADH-quinone oxidoreductase subunit L